MRKQIAGILLLASMASWCYGQYAAKEVMEIMKDYVSDSTAEDGFLSAKHWLKNIESISAADIEVGQPIQEYRIKYNMLDTCADSIPFYKLLEPKDYWIFPIRTKDRYLYEVNVSKFEGKWHISGRAELPSDNMWQQLRSAFPESTGINPMLVVDGLSKYLYFKQKGLRKIYYIKPGFQNDSLEMVTTSSMSALDDTKKLLRHWKKKGKGSNNELDKMLLRRSQAQKSRGGK
jgi:hypothetical protein